MTDEPILELSSLPPEREKVRIRTDADPEGTIYELAVPEDFRAVELGRIGRLVEEVDELWTVAELNGAQETRLEAALNEIATQLIRDVPAESVAALPAIVKKSLAIRFLVTANVGAADIVSSGGE